MTIQELYEWAKDQDALDLPIGLQYQDSGGSFEGDTFQDNVGCTAKVETSIYLEKYVLLS